MKHMVTASSCNVLEKSIWQDSCHIDFLYISNRLALWFGFVSLSSRLLSFLLSFAGAECIDQLALRSMNLPPSCLPSAA
jgi:hypothetical protein